MNVKTSHLLIVGLVFYAIISFFSLTQFPFVHSDEAWLAGLSQTMISENTVKTTESFFDLYPRYPHGIKIFFNALQITAIKLLGFRIFSVRLISLVFSLASAVLFYLLLSKILCRKGLALAITLLLLLNIQFIYMSHMARQEAVLLFLMLLNLYYVFHKPGASPGVSGLIAGLAIGIHPNSFLIFLPVLAFWLLTKDWKKILHFVGTVGALALAFVLFSLALDPLFIPHYFSYGRELGVTMSFWDKLLQLGIFYQKLYYGVSGTYYTPDIRGFFLVFGFSTLFNLYLVLRGKIHAFPLAALMGLHLGLIVIGRYNQTSIILTLPLYLAGLGLVLAQIKPRSLVGLLMGLMLLFTGFNTLENLQSHYYEQSYEDYLSHFKELVPQNTRVLGNLNALFAFRPENFFDLRNLRYLPETSTFEDYIRERDIEYILYSEEMDFIYERRPLWNDLYGNLYPYYEQMQLFFEESCQEAGTFESPTYGMRIVRYIEKKPYRVILYKVNSSP
ncbi:MAG: hypothetical protein AVO33_05275 [delta proteobacterium ML8_F1]|nr:MAG: hypothetical protein AVO33_05275 [delta proteobacterium ML8_F1]